VQISVLESVLLLRAEKMISAPIDEFLLKQAHQALAYASSRISPDAPDFIQLAYELLIESGADPYKELDRQISCNWFFTGECPPDSPRMDLAHHGLLRDGRYTRARGSRETIHEISVRARQVERESQNSQHRTTARSNKCDGARHLPAKTIANDSPVCGNTEAAHSRDEVSTASPLSSQLTTEPDTIEMLPRKGRRKGIENVVIERPAAPLKTRMQQINFGLEYYMPRLAEAGYTKEAIVFGLLLKHAYGNGEVSESMRSLARASKISLATVQRCIKRMLEFGISTLTFPGTHPERHSKGLSARYQITHFS